MNEKPKFFDTFIDKTLYQINGLSNNSFSLIHHHHHSDTMSSIVLAVQFLDSSNLHIVRPLCSDDEIISYCETVMVEEYVEDGIDNEYPSERLAFYLSLFEVIKNAYLYHKKALSL